MNINININDQDKITNSVALSEIDAVTTYDGGIAKATFIGDNTPNNDLLIDIGTPPVWLSELIGTNITVETTSMENNETNDAGTAPIFN